MQLSLRHMVRWATIILNDKVVTANGLSSGKRYHDTIFKSGYLYLIIK